MIVSNIQLHVHVPTKDLQKWTEHIKCTYNYIYIYTADYNSLQTILNIYVLNELNYSRIQAVYKQL